MSPLGIVFRALVILIAFIAAFALLAFAIHLLQAVFFIVATLACILFAVFVYKRVFRKGSGSEIEEPSGGTASLTSKDGNVRLFNKEPGVSDLVYQASDSESDKAQLPSTHLMIEVPSEIEVEILEESDLALKIKIKDGAQKGKVGWVDKSHVKRS